MTMQILILYFSKGGNTRKLAGIIAQGVKEVEGAKAIVRSTGEVTKADFVGSAGIIAGSPVYFGGMAAELKRVFDQFVGVRKKMEGKVGAAFTTSGDATGGKETTMMSIMQAMLIYGEFAAGLAERILVDLEVDAAIFSEPIGGNHGSLISPMMYEEFVLVSYEPILDVLRKFGVQTIIMRTYANMRSLIPSMLKWGINCLWACEVNIEAMDYIDLRRTYGHQLRLIGGIDLDILRSEKEIIQREIERTVPPLVTDGGYVPLADGRVREDVPFENYAYYRHILEQVTR